MRRKKSALKIIFPLACFAIIFLGGIFILRSLFAGFLLSFSISVPTAPAVPSSAVPVSNPISSAALQGSFTELFSGTGWVNQDKTSVYQDQTLSSISFPPDYGWQEIPALSYGINGETIIAANGNGKEIILVAQSGKIFEFQNDTKQISEIRVNPLLNSGVPRESASIFKNALLDYDDAKQAWVVAAVSENGDAFIGSIGQVSPIGQIGHISDLACANGECLLIASQSIYSFSESDPSALIRVSLPGVRVNPLLSIGKAKNTLLVGAVEKNSGAYSGNIFKYSTLASPEPLAKAGGSLSLIINYQSSLPAESLLKAGVISNQSLFSSTYPGTIRFGYDSENSQVLALYAAYIGQAYKFSVNPLLDSGVPRLSASTIEDYSHFFPQRVMDGNTTPKIFKYGNAWWLSSEINQASTKFIRIEGGAGVDFADTLLRGQQAFELLPGFKSNELYAVVSNQPNAKIYKFTDNGYKEDKKIVWESTKLNPWDGVVVGGSIFRADGDENGGKINYFLSPDGGKNWLPTKLNEPVEFTQNKTGNDFRFRIEMSPSGNAFKSPWMNVIGAEYSVSPRVK